ncbi:MAG: flavin reductase family protein [Caulobacteraceae bacterium]|nr:flavin reductase family protein [Caulobacteraceae bacterium]
MAGAVNAPAAGGPTPAEWRAAMGSFPTGVTIITSWQAGRPVGSTISAFCSVSLVPPLLLFCLDFTNPLLEPVRASGVFGVNILAEEDGAAIARHFAVNPEADRFERYPYRAEPGGAPQLEAAPVFIDCLVEQTMTAGDHLVLIGRGLRTDHPFAAPPLVYHQGKLGLPRP